MKRNNEDIKSDENQLKKVKLEDPNEALSIALEKLDLSLVKLAKEAGADIDDSLKRHVYLGNDEFVDLLLQAGADPSKLNEKGLNLLFYALKYPKVAKLLMAHKAKLTLNDSENALASVGKDIIGVKEMKLFSAESKKNKTYPFAVTIFNMREIDDYLSVLKASKNNIDEINETMDAFGLEGLKKRLCPL